MSDEQLGVDHTYRSRKFGLSVAAFINAGLFLGFGWIAGEIWQAVVLGVLALYAMGSVGDKFAKKK